MAGLRGGELFAVGRPEGRSAALRDGSTRTTSRGPFADELMTISRQGLAVGTSRTRGDAVRVPEGRADRGTFRPGRARRAIRTRHEQPDDAPTGAVRTRTPQPAAEDLVADERDSRRPRTAPERPLGSAIPWFAVWPRPAGRHGRPRRIFLDSFSRAWESARASRLSRAESRRPPVRCARIRRLEPRRRSSRAPPGQPDDAHPPGRARPRRALPRGRRGASVRASLRESLGREGPRPGRVSGGRLDASRCQQNGKPYGVLIESL